MTSLVRAIVVALILTGSAAQGWGLWRVIARQRKVSKAFNDRNRIDNDAANGNYPAETLDPSPYDIAVAGFGYAFGRNDLPLDVIGEREGPMSLVLVMVGIGCNAAAGVVAALA